MEIFEIALVGIITAICVVVVKESRPDVAALIGITGGMILVIAAIESFTGVFSTFSEIIESSGVDKSVVKSVLKVVGIGYVCDFAAGTAEDVGQKSLAEKIAFAGKAMILCASLPMLKFLFEIITSFVS